MSVTSPPVLWLFAGTLMAASTVGLAEAPPRSDAPVKTAPEPILQATKMVPPKTRSAPPRELYPAQDLFRVAPRRVEHIPNGCTSNSASLCFDYRTGRALYKPMRRLLPRIPGMTPHNLSIHRDKVVAQYTFK